MGLTVHDIRLLLQARRGFSRALTLGRQWVFAAPDQLRQIGINVPQTFAYGGFFEESGTLSALGIADLTIADASPYEGATLVHDFNTPLPREYDGRYDLVVDGGTLEHIFNAPIALASCMRALRVGGTYFGSHPANNLMGHGFYQFSPEFYYRAFAESNGFRVEKLEIHESRYPAVELGFVRRRYVARDPDTVGDRVSLQSARAAMIRVVAVKTQEVPLFAQWPQQTDYVRSWHGNVRLPATRFRTLAQRHLPGWLLRHFVGWRHRRRASLANRNHFQLPSPNDYREK